MNWKPYFFFTQGERRGVIALLLITSMLLFVRVLLANRYEGSPDDTVGEPFVSTATHYPAKTDEMVELNAADTTLLKRLRGIGSGYAKMIVNYRDKLGGFYCKEQLLEVYHFPQETYNRIESQVWVDTTYVHKMPINQLSIDALKRHPYIRYFQAKSLYDNRLKQPNQRYNGSKDLVIDRDVTPDFVQRIAPYLSFQ